MLMSFRSRWRKVNKRSVIKQVALVRFGVMWPTLMSFRSRWRKVNIISANKQVALARFGVTASKSGQH
jgi:hypothetical protein